jgi:hypothetical protein
VAVSRDNQQILYAGILCDLVKALARSRVTVPGIEVTGHLDIANLNQVTQHVFAGSAQLGSEFSEKWFIQLWCNPSRHHRLIAYDAPAAAGVFRLGEFRS